MYDTKSLGNRPPDMNLDSTTPTDEPVPVTSGTDAAGSSGRVMTPQEYAQMAGRLSSSELRKLSPEQLDRVLPYLTPEQVAEIFPALSERQLEMLRPGQLSSLSASQVARIFLRLSLEQIAALKTAQIAAVPADQISDLISGLSPEQLHKIVSILSAAQLRPMLAQQAWRVVPHLSARQVAELLPFLSAGQLSSLRPNQLTRLSAEQLVHFLSHLDERQLRKFIPTMPLAMLAKLSGAQQALVAPYLEPEQVSDMWNGLGDESIRLLRAAQLSMLTAEQVKEGFDRLPPQQWAGLTPGQMARLTPAQAALLLPFLTNKKAFSAGTAPLSAANTEKVRQGAGPLVDDTDSSTEDEPVDASGDPEAASPTYPQRPPPVLRVEKPASLSPLEVKQMFPQLTREQLRELKPNQFGNLSGEEITHVLSVLSPAEMERLLPRLSEEQIGAIAWSRNTAWLTHLPPDRIGEALSQLGGEEIRTLSLGQLSALSAKDIGQIFGRLSPEQAQRLKPEQLKDISPEELEKLMLGATPQRLAILVPSLSPTQLMRQPWDRKSPWLQSMTPEQVVWLMPHLSDREVKILRPVTLTALTSSEVARSSSKFSLEQLAGLQPVQLTMLSDAQKKRIEEYRSGGSGLAAAGKDAAPGGAPDWRTRDLV